MRTVHQGMLTALAALGLLVPNAHAAETGNESGVAVIIGNKGIQSSVLDASSGRQRRGYDAFDGTSMAAPHMAGGMALLRQAAPQANMGELLAALKATGRRLDDTRRGLP